MGTRVYELAKELDLPSKQVVAACQAAGLDITNHASSLTDDQAEQVRRLIADGGAPAPAKKVKKKAAKKKAAKKKVAKKKATRKKAAEKTEKATTKKKAAKKKAKRKAKKKPPPPEAAPGSAAAAAAAAQLSAKLAAQAAKEAEKEARKREAKKKKRKKGKGTAATAAQPTEGDDGAPIIRMDEETKEERQAKRVSLAPSVQELLRRYTPEAERQRVIRRRRRRPRRSGRRAAPKPPPTVKRKRKITLGLPVTVKDLSAAIGVKAGLIIRDLLQSGVVATINQVLDPEAAKTIAYEHGSEIEIRTERDLEQELLDAKPETRDEDLAPRAPVVAFLGHVDHGKTSLLDAIRKTHVQQSESGGITQHIGAYKVAHDPGHVVFLDTPGHEAFTAMRARGANATDIVVLVVAADDGVMPQTEEAINHAKAAGVPIVVALNKMDRPEANPDRVKTALANLELTPEEWGGETIFVETSAVTGQGLDDLVEMLALQAEMLDLQASPGAPATGVALEAELTQGRGVVATLLVRDGTLTPGDVLLCGPGFGRIRSIRDDQGRRLKEAGPSTPIGVTGLSRVPEAGDQFHVVKDLNTAKEVALNRQRQQRQVQLGERSQITLENLFSRISEGKTKELLVVLKADVKGSLEVLQQSLTELSTDEVRVKLIHSGVGPITQSDVDLAFASDAVIIGFHVAPEEHARVSAAERGVDIRLYQVIYHATEEVRDALEGLLEPVEQEVVTGHAEVRQLFRISRFGTIAGCFVTDGTIARSSRARVIRDGEALHAGPLISLKRFKDDVREVREGFECGIRIEGFDGFEEGDRIEAFTIEKVARRLSKPV